MQLDSSLISTDFTFNMKKKKRRQIEKRDIDRERQEKGRLSTRK